VTPAIIKTVCQKKQASKDKPIHADTCTGLHIFFMLPPSFSSLNTEKMVLKQSDKFCLGDCREIQIY